MSEYTVEGQLETFLPFQATVVRVFPDGKIEARVTENETEIIDPLYYGGVRDSGLFMNPDIGDTLLCVRVHPGSKGVTQAVRVLPAKGRDEPLKDGDGTLPEGSSPYPELSEGEVRILSSSGSEVSLRGAALNSEASLSVYQKAGIFAAEDGDGTYATVISDIQQNISAGSRLITGDIVRPSGQNQFDISIGHDLYGLSKIPGLRRGAYDGVEAQDIALLGAPRNPTLSEYRLVVNEFSENSAFTGWDTEFDFALSNKKKTFGEKEKEFVSPRGSLSLAPHQLIEIVAGNLVSAYGESLDINYGTIEIGDFEGKQVVDSLAYESDRIVSRRGVGYHFQLSTNSRSNDLPNDTDNFVCAIDKQGVLKVSVPKGSGVGNVPFPTSASFDADHKGVITGPLHPTKEEGVPVTLRDKLGNVILPVLPPSQQMAAAEKRNTGVRFSNSSSYFNGFGNIAEGGGSNRVRVNFTAHHNMYAAAEMLIANTIRKISVPEATTECEGGMSLGTAIGEPFERYYGDLNAEGKLKDNELKYMSTVAVNPGQPAMYTGGGTVVGGKSFLTEKDGQNQPYTNSFTVGLDSEGNFTYSNTDAGAKNQKDPGGKSANLNFEGAVDVSVGKDEYDQKSLVLDTAGSVIAWFGRDRNGRSLVVQTDGDVAVNIGGRGMANGVEGWREGRLDLRVNVTDKGPVHLSEDWKTDGGDHASDYIISISKEGLVIAGMNPGAPMVVRNDGNLSIESTGKLSLGAQSIEIREGNSAPRKTWKSPTASDQPAPNLKTVSEKITCITDVIQEMTEG